MARHTSREGETPTHDEHRRSFHRRRWLWACPPPSPISYLKGSQLSSVSCAVGFILCAFLSIPKSPTETMHTDVA